MSEFDAALIAGGRSRRMGTDKAFLEWEGRPLWQHQLEKLRALGPGQLMLSGRPDQAFPELPDVTRVPDECDDAGPLAGIVACLRRCTAPLLVVLAVDLPRLPGHFLRRLLDESNAGQGAAVRLADYYEPLAAVYPRSALPLAEQHLAAGRLALQDWIHAATGMGILRCVQPPLSASWFENWNSPEDVARHPGAVIPRAT